MTLTRKTKYKRANKDEDDGGGGGNDDDDDDGGDDDHGTGNKDASYSQSSSKTMRQKCPAVVLAITTTRTILYSQI